jgi:acetylornithine aminotransferase
VLKQQASTLLHASNVYHTPWPGKLAERLVRLTKKRGGLGFAAGSEEVAGENPGIQVFFANSGTEANEGALKIAKKVGKERWARKHKGRGWDATQDGDCSKTGIVCFEVRRSLHCWSHRLTTIYRQSGFHGRSMGALSVTWNAKYQKPFEPLIPGVSVGRLNDTSSLDLVEDDTCVVIVEPIQVRLPFPYHGFRD